jgi:hypothetical protein
MEPGRSAQPGRGEQSTTIDAERRHSQLLAAPDEDTFVAKLLAGFGSYPPYFLRLRERNRAGPELLGPDWRVLPLLSADRVREHVPGGGVLVDAQPLVFVLDEDQDRGELVRQCRRPPPGRGRHRVGRPGRRPAPGRAAHRAGHGDVWPWRAGHDRSQPPRPRRPQGPPGRARRPQDWQQATGQALARS